MSSGLARCTNWAWLLLLLPACHSTAPYEYEGRDSNATIVVYRRASVNLAALAAYVGVDERLIARIGNDDFVEIQLPPGPHQLRAAAQQYRRAAIVKLDVRDLDRLYFEARPNPSNASMAAASTVDPTAIGGAIGAMYLTLFSVPFLLEPRTEDDFRKVVDKLERVEPQRPPPK